MGYLGGPQPDQLPGPGIFPPNYPGLTTTQPGYLAPMANSIQGLPSDQAVARPAVGTVGPVMPMGTSSPEENALAELRAIRHAQELQGHPGGTGYLFGALLPVEEPLKESEEEKASVGQNDLYDVCTEVGRVEKESMNMYGVLKSALGELKAEKGPRLH